jgi:hypothetical protein
MADDDTETGSADQQTSDTGDESKPDGKTEDGKAEGKGKDSKPEGKGSGDKKADDKDGEQERKDLFAEATGDPLADAQGGPAARAGAAQALRSWIRTVHASGAAAFVGGGNIGVLNINTATADFDRRGHAPGPVRPEIMSELTDRYVPVPGYETLVKRLETGRLLLLRGAPGTGRTTTGLQLLASLTNSVARFGPNTDLHALTASDLKPQSGYLIDLNPGPGFLPLATAQVELLRDYLTERECYLVLIAPHDIRYRDGFDGYIADCPLPDARKLFHHAMEYAIRRRPSQVQALRKTAADAWPQGSPGPQTPSEVHWLVTHLTSAATSSYTSADLDRLNSELAARYVAAWFEPLAGIPVTAAGDESVRLAAFRISLAVLNQTSFAMVAEAAEDLAERILVARAPRRMPGRPVFARHREDHVPNSRAKVVDGLARYLYTTAPMSLATYDDDRLALAVLSHVWALHNLRGPLLSWLESLCELSQPFVSTRAALTAGLFAAWDFPNAFHRQIETWAGSADKKRRWTAALALDEVSRNEQVRPVMREILEDWCEEGSFEQRWTSAVALGFNLGLQDPERTLKELQKLGCWKDGKLVHMASWAVARIFVLGQIEPVIKTLDRWLGDDRGQVRWLGIVTVYRIARVRVGELESQFELSSNADGRWKQLTNRPRWPLVVALAEEDPSLLEPLADLVWHLTRSALAEKDTGKALQRWMRAGKKDPTCIGPVGRFLALLGDDPSDRARLLRLVRSLRQDRDEPLPAAIAGRFERAIAHNIHITGEMG